MRSYRRNLSSVLLASVMIYLGTVPASESWGIEGHYATCKIAQPLLTEEASAAVNGLLPDYAKGDLASLCSWADQVRFRYRWSSPLHFIDTPDNKCSYIYSRDCHNAEGKEGMCVDGAIKNYTSELRNYGGRATGVNYNLTEALLFLSHFMGDIHQPLHVGFTTDEGGNTIKLHWYGQQSNLHHVWDSLIIETAMKDYYDNDLEEMIAAIQKNVTGNWSDEVPNWENCSTDILACPTPYADESISLACNWAYKDADEDSVLKDDYFFSRLPIVETQLAKGGVRLAATLNRIFNSTGSY